MTPKGRRVRCSRCAHTWFQEPRAPLPEPAVLPSYDAVDPPPLGRSINLPALPTRRRRRPPIGWLALGLFVIAVVAGSYFGRGPIMDAWPPSARLYEALGLADEQAGAGLEIRNVASERRIEGTAQVLVIEGSIANLTDRPVTVPPLRIALRGPDRTELYFWTFRASVEVLMPGQSAPFETRLDRDVQGAASFAVTFASAGEERG